MEVLVRGSTVSTLLPLTGPCTVVTSLPWEVVAHSEAIQSRPRCHIIPYKVFTEQAVNNTCKDKNKICY